MDADNAGPWLRTEGPSAFPPVSLAEALQLEREGKAIVIRHDEVRAQQERQAGCDHKNTVHDDEDDTDHCVDCGAWLI